MVTNEYAAGFFDGEGCVCVAKMNKPDGRSGYTAFMTITNNQLAPLQAIQERFGGRINAKGKDRLGWVLQLTGHKSRLFAEAISPHLMCKGPQVELLLEFLDLGNGHNKEERARLRKAISDENQRHRQSNRQG